MFEQQKIIDNIFAVRQKINSLGSNAMLLAATKTQPKEVVDFVLDKVLVDAVGENRVQEFTEKYDDKNKNLRHFIGRLQSNKVKYLVGKAELIQSLDSLSLAAEIQKQAIKNSIEVNCLIEVNVGAEEAKGGILLGDLQRFLNEIKVYDKIKIQGLMGVMPKTQDINTLCNLYGMLGNAYDCLKKQEDFKILSAGMSNDYQAAIEYANSNMIRLGSAIFGLRTV